MRGKVLWLAMVLALLTSALAGEARLPMPADEAGRANLLLAAAAIDGVVLSPSDEFSFNRLVGERTAERGYLEAPNGRGVSVVGGGVAEAASAVYLAVRDFGGSVAFDALSFYGGRYTGSYVPDGSEAVLVDWSEGVDFAFTNLTGRSMRITIGEDDGALVCGAELLPDDESLPVLSMDRPGSAPDRVPRGAVLIPLPGDEGARSNIRLAADSVFETVLNNQDVFSFNGAVGPRDEAGGYCMAPDGSGAVISGGGVDAVASAVWLAVRDRPDIAVIEKETYGSAFVGGYVDRESDAIRTDDAAHRDFSFRYLGAGSLTIYVWIQDDALYCLVQTD